MEVNLISTFAEFKELKNIDRPTMMSVLEDIFRTQLIKMYGSADNFDIIINIDKGDLEKSGSSRESRGSQHPDIA